MASSWVNDDIEDCDEDEDDAKYNYEYDDDDDGDVAQVVPNVMCIALYSPPLDSIGNSVRGQQFCKVLTVTINIIIIIIDIVVMIMIITATMIRSWWIFSIFTVLTT